LICKQFLLLKHALVSTSPEELRLWVEVLRLELGILDLEAWPPDGSRRRRAEWC
jgi:hypothetical protein